MTTGGGGVLTCLGKVRGPIMPVPEGTVEYSVAQLHFRRQAEFVVPRVGLKDHRERGPAFLSLLALWALLDISFVYPLTNTPSRKPAGVPLVLSLVGV